MSKTSQDKLSYLENQSVETDVKPKKHETAPRRNIRNPEELLSTFRPTDDEEYSTVYDSI